MNAETGPASGVVLIVDDNAASRYIAGSWLRRHGYAVLEATDGTSALVTLAHERVDLVVLDVGLPDMSGFDVCTRIKSDPRLGHPVIHLSATSIRGMDRAQGLNRGADAYLTEPVEPDELVATVDSVLRYYRARDAAERLATNFSLLATATHAMHTATTFEQLTEAIAAGAATIFRTTSLAAITSDGGVARRSVATLSRDGTPFTTTTSHSGAKLRDDDPPPGGTARRALPVAMTPDGAADWTSLTVVPRSGTLSLTVAVKEPSLRADHEGVLTQLGHAAALAAQAMRSYADEHDLALTLQRSFLPDLPPALPGLQTAVRYEPAGNKAEIGGDFYEIVQLDDHRVLIAIGDVAGHSIHAATIMVELRHALRAYALDDHEPTEVLHLLDRVLRRYHRRELATLCLLVLDTRDDRLLIANAGHLPPLLLTPEGAEYITVHGPLLGLGLERRGTTTHQLPPVWGLVLVTDGLIEEPGVDLDEAMERLRVAASLDSEPEALCVDLLSRFGLSRRDDIALLVVRRPEPRTADTSTA